MNELPGRSCPSFDATPRVDLWCACPADIDDPRLLHAYRALLSEAERERQDRFLFARDRHRDLVTRALVRIVLSRYADLAPEAWRFVPNRYGRPGIANPAAGLRDLSFNISHGGARVIVAVARAASRSASIPRALPRARPRWRSPSATSRATRRRRSRRFRPRCGNSASTRLGPSRKPM